MTEEAYFFKQDGMWWPTNSNDPNAVRFVRAKPKRPAPTEVPKRLSLNEQHVLWVFANSPLCWHEQLCLGFQGTGLPRELARRVMRRLARLGLLSFHRGLFTEDGEVAGAGYALTDLGREAVTYLNLLHPDMRWQ